MKLVLILLNLMMMLVLLAPQLFAALPSQAFLRAGEHGQALLLSRLGECYAVTPKHVIGDELFATLIGGRAGAPQGDADLLQTFGYDLSILRATGTVARQCGGALTAVPPLDNLLAGATAGIVSSINSDGSVTRRNVTLNDVGLIYLRVRPLRPEDQLFKGLSGSLVLADEQPIGILMTVDAGTGEGRALRYDRAIETLRPFFGLPGERRTDITTEGGAPPGSAGLTAQVVSWSSPSLGGEFRAANLVDAAGEETIWLAQAVDFPIELVIELPGDKTQAVNAVRLVGAGVEPAERLPRDFEILISSRPGGGWVPVSSGTYFRNEHDKLVRFMPVRARRIMLRIYSNWDDSEAVGLSQVEVSTP